MNCLQCKNINDTIQKLAAYEGTNLTPERCAELALAEKDGRLVVLPCKLDNTVYYHDNNKWKVYHIELFDGCTVFRLKNGDNGYCAVTSDEMNEKWWLTREEAEAALSEMKGELQ